ncbi:MAG: RDD family protein [Treponema sp.]|jgi:uncharacterized RDD family membrane protein YckC|nr:RDD family protein [Treponema sp.]
MTERALEDTSLQVQTPEGIEYVLYPAGPLVRACAYGIDLFFQWLLLGVLVILYGMILHTITGVWLIFLAQFILDWFYHIFWELLFRGQSPGKRFMGIRVVSGGGSPAGFGSSMIRNLLRFVDSFMGLFFIGFLSITVSPGFRRLGDWAAGTLVIHTWQSQAPERREPMAWLGEIPSAVPGRTLSGEEKQGILMFARRYPLLGAARAGEIALPLAHSLEGGGRIAVTGAAAADPAGNPAEYLLGIARTLETP